MKKLLTSMLILVGTFLLIGCQGNNKEEEPPQENKKIELIQDNTFQNGFRINPADKDPQPENRFPLEYNLRYKDTSEQIMWSLSQMGSRYGLADEYAIDKKEIEEENGNYILEDTSKKVVIGNDGSLTLEYNTSLEYLEPRKSMEAWPHLILEQGFKEHVMLNDALEVNLSLEITLNKLIRQMTNEEYNSGLHTAQFLMFIVLRSNSSVDSGEYVWFGIPFLDARYQYTPESGNFDAGTGGNTGKFIYVMPQIEFMPNGLPLEETVNININLIPYFHRALIMAQSRGALLNTTVDDLYIMNMNIGYEIPGTYDVSITIKDLSLMAHMK
ncbi:MAG: hypothetical protein WC907_01460 [Acholeplasmataceae bacterium]